MHPITEILLRRWGPKFLALVATAGAAIGGCTPDPTGPNARYFLRYVSGNQQQGPPGTVLSAPLVLRTWNALYPVGLKEVDWVVVSGGGTLVTSGRTSDGNGYASAQWTLGVAPGTQSVLVHSDYGDTIRFSATAQVAGKTWTGAVSVFWSNPDNWSPVGVPSGADNVLIPAHTPRPELTTLALSRDLSGDSGVAIQLWGHDVQVAGNLVWPGSMISTGGRTWLAGSGTIEGTAINARLTGTYMLSGTTTFLGSGLDIENGTLDLNGKRATTSNLSVTGFTALLIMQDRDFRDTLVVQGDALFDGADETGHLSYGLLEVRGSFAQRSSVSPKSFLATFGHSTLLRGTATAAQVSFESPQQSKFNYLYLVPSTNPIVFSTDVSAHWMRGPEEGPPAVIVASAATSVTVEDVLANLVLDGLRAVIEVADNTNPYVEGVVFRNSPTTGAQLALSGAGGLLETTLNGLVFATVPVAGGVYLRATDTDATQGVFVVNVTNTSPATGAPYVETVNGAVVNWGPPPAPCPGATRTWTGAVSNDWHNPSNWNPTGVPGRNDDVCVPAGLARYPRVDAADAEVRDLVGEAGALISGQFNLDIYGDLNWAGTTAANFGAVRLVGTSGTVQGTMTPLTVMGDYTVTGRLTVATQLKIEPGRLTLDGHTVSVGQLEVGVINALGTGLLVMTNPLDSLLTTGVSASVFFHGGDHTGLLTAGVLQVGGNFTQLFGTTSFVASGTHRTVFTPGPFGTHTVRMFSPQAHFGDLDVSAAGTVTFNFSGAAVQGQLIATPAAGAAAPVLSTSGAYALVAGGVNVTGLTLSRLRLRIDSGSISAFRNVVFTGFQNLGFIQLEVRHAGQAMPFVFDNLSFADVPAAGGFYLSATDTDPTTPPLTITVCCSSPASGAPYVRTANGAVVNW